MTAPARSPAATPRRFPFARGRATAVATTALVVPGVALGVSAARLSYDPLLVALLAWFAAAAIIFGARSSLGSQTSGWVASIGLVPWAAIVLLPWGLRRTTGSWLLAGVAVDPQLGNSWSLHLWALFGVTIGSVSGIVLAGMMEPRVRVARSTRRRDIRMRLMTRPSPRATRVLVILVAMYLASFVVARRPIAALWRLGGEVRYFDQVDEAQRIALLDFSLGIASWFFLFSVAARRLRGADVPRQELGWLCVLCVLLLGTGGRYHFYTVVVGWGVIQFGPAFRRGRMRAHQLVALAVATPVALAIVSYSASEIAVRRMGLTHDGGDGLIATTVRSIDVISSTEVLFTVGGEPGILKGESYRELPLLFLPRRYNPDKPHPAADLLVRRTLSETAGYAAPLWIEPALNAGRAATAGFAAFYCFAGIIWFHRLKNSSPRAPLIYAIGATWVLTSYQLLSRLTIFQFLTTLGIICIAGLLAGRFMYQVPSDVIPATDA